LKDDGATSFKYISSAVLIIGGILTLRSFNKKDAKKALFTKELPVYGFYSKTHLISIDVILIIFGLAVLLK
jgi:hypothetical protein